MAVRHSKSSASNSFTAHVAGVERVDVGLHDLLVGFECVRHHFRSQKLGLWFSERASEPPGSKPVKTMRTAGVD